MDYHLVYALVVIVFITNECNAFYIESDRSVNSVDDRPYHSLKSKNNYNSIDNSIPSVRKIESRKKSCGQILIETLPMICQHSSDLFGIEDNYEYSDGYEDSESRTQKTKKNIVEECCVNKCSFQDLINFCHQ